MVLFYMLVPVPTAVAKRHLNSMGDGTGGQEFALFLTLSLIISSFALPIVLSHASVVSFLLVHSMHENRKSIKCLVFFSDCLAKLLIDCMWKYCRLRHLTRLFLDD